MSKKVTTKVLSLRRSPIIAEMPKACGNEAAAVEFLEQQRWEGKAVCPRCASDAVYQMKSVNGQDRNARFLWMCRPCHKQFTVRVGTIFEDSKVALHKWCLAYWLCAAAKNGLPAFQSAVIVQSANASPNSV